MEKILSILMVAFVLMACGKDSRSDVSESPTKTGQQENSIAKEQSANVANSLKKSDTNKSGIDELIGRNATDIAGLKGSINNINKQLEKLDNKTEDLQNKMDTKLSMLFFYFSLILFLLLAVVSIMALIRANNAKKTASQNSKIKFNPKDYVTQKELEKDLENLKRQLKKIEDKAPVNSETLNKSTSVYTNVKTQKEEPAKASSSFYLGNYSGGIFRKKYESNSEEALFSVKEIKKGVYEITSLNLAKLLTMTSRGTVVQNEGCAWEEAKDFKCIEPGIVKYVNEDGGYWKVERKVKVKLTK